MKLRSRWAATAITVVVAGSLLACGSGSGGAAVQGPWQDVVAAAEEEGQVNFYSVMSPAQNDRLVKEFNEQYPDIQVTVTRGAGELPPRVEAEIKSRSDGADVFLHIDPAWFIDNQADLMAIDSPSTQGWSDDGWAVRGKAIIPSTSPYSIFVWNTQRFPDGFDTWDDLRDPSVKGSLGLRSEVAPSLAGFLDFQERALGADYLSALGKLQPKFYPSVVPMTQAVASGEIGVTNASAPSMVKALQARGAPIDSAIPEPSYWTEWGAGVLQKSQRPNAARVFLDFIMSKQGQAAINGDGFGASSRDGVQGTLEVPQGATLLDSEKFSQPEVVSEFKKKFKTWFG